MFSFSKKTLLTSHSLAVFLIILGIVVIVNALSARYFVRFDITEDNEYTISGSTKQILRSLDDIVTVKVFFSKELPPNLMPLSQYVHDILDEYSAFSKGNVQVKYIDPASDPALGQEVQMLGIPEVQMNVIEKDKFGVQNGYLGIGVFYVDKKEILPVVQNTSNLEYELTSAIRKVTVSDVKTIGFLTGHEEQIELSILEEALRKHYEVRDVSIADGQAISGVDTLIVAGPKKALSERDVFEIDQFIMHGGNAIFLLDRVNAATGLLADPLLTGLEDFLKHYGITVEQNLVMDAFHEYASFSQGFMRYVLPYPLWPKIVTLDKENPLVAKLESFLLPWASSLSVAEKEGVSVNVLATTTDKSWVMSENFNLDPNQEFRIPSDAKTYDMLALVSGSPTSYFSGKEIPPVVASEDAVALSPTVSASETRTIQDAPDQEIRFLVLGDSDAFVDNFISQFPQNLDLVLNMVDFLTLDDALIGIRSKGASDRPLQPISDSMRSMVKFFGVAGMSILVIAYGVMRLYFRKRRDPLSF